MVRICNRVIEYSFYTLFLLVPLAFTSKTSELFELNKMWLTWGITIIIGTFWFIKMILQRRILLCRTPLDIPIMLFLLSQIISTIFSLDFHTSVWGYYSRFNGGLLSIMSYVLLYYAFLSNSPTLAKAQRLLTISLISGAIVALWGLPSHFGYDPTCLLFRGTFDVSCWTADFLPKVRIFSTLGQPDWLAAYLAILIPISIAFFINSLKSNSLKIDKKYYVSSIMYHVVNRKIILTTCYILLTTLFYVDLLYTRARSGILGIWIALIFFFGLYFWTQRKNLKSLIINPLSLIIGLLLLITFVIGTPINQFNKFTLAGIGSYFQKTANTETMKQNETQKEKTPAQTIDSGGTESASIRMNVWNGAIKAWRANPLFGTGVETFAYAYYKYKPVGQNLTSEWNFLYNKAHNEYLNYLATTGIFGLGTYLLMIGSFLFLTFKHLNSNIKYQNPKQIQNHNDKNSKHFGYSNFENLKLFSASNFEFRILTLALLAGYISILITNFFGFSVVITNIYLFMIPAFIFILTGMLSKNESGIRSYESSNLYQWTAIFFIILTSLFMILKLFRFWQADIAFALGYNLDRAGEYQQAYPHLHKAVKLRGGEPVFKDELSVNSAIIAVGLIAQKNQKNTDQAIAVASSLTQEAINASNEIVVKYPNNAVFWKTRTKLFYSLSQVDSRYLPRALDAIEKASLLAPADANIWYNLGVMYGQNNNLAKGIEALEKTIMLKPDYRDAYYALGLFYHTAGQNEKAIAQMQYILNHLASKDAGAKESLKDWGAL